MPRTKQNQKDMVLPTDYIGYVTVAATTEVGYVRPHPALPGTWTLSLLWRPDDPAVRPLTPVLQAGPYRVDLAKRTCTCLAFLKGAGPTPLYRRSCKHLDQYSLVLPEHTTDLMSFVPHRVPFQLFGNRIPKQFRLPTDQWYWSLKYDGIRVGLHATGFGTTQHGLCLDLRSLLPPTWTQLAATVGGTLTLGSDIVFDAELVPVRARQPPRLGHNVTMEILHQNTLTGLEIRIFDIVAPACPFQLRYETLCRVPAFQPMLVEQHALDTCAPACLLAVLTDHLAAGHEGLVLRQKKQHYMCGQRTGAHAFKLKSVAALQLHSQA